MRIEYGQNYNTLYNQHWWWRAREHAVLSEISQLNLKPKSEILDFGCGNALFFPKLSQFGSVVGIETDASLLTETPYRSQIYTSPIESQEYANLRFDLIVSLDVLEHIENDRAALLALSRLLKPRGVILLTAPSSMKLWDEHDEQNLHFRRYTEQSFLKIVPNNLEVLKIRSFNHWTYIPKRLVSLINKNRKKKFNQATIPPEWLNRGLINISKIDYHIGSLIQIPFGSSILMILRAK